MMKQSSMPRSSAMDLLERSALFTLVPKDGDTPEPLSKNNYTIETIPQREQLFLGKDRCRCTGCYV